ncbi:tyrosine type site-specific recombinase [Nonlabens ulvanivorans]|uniref:Tyrosine type site-specific recombinase n=1 Tax=Nonlabens ulvanivorans TaxID=906888 RepID=A0A090WIJ3_NONUL|nr:site-specific integrase [Nonlabens ulvanivorans]GAL75988.1 tyrosine type site-specific recombinase [Nonlabens ulvanivorans]
MNRTFGILFYLKKSKVDSNGLTPIYLRITVDGVRKEVSVKRRIEQSKWSTAANKAVGRSSDIKELNAYLDIITSKLYQHHKDLIESGERVTAEKIKNKYLGRTIQDKTILQIFKKHNDEVRQLIGNGFAAGTLDRYETVYNHLSDFMLHKYNESDLELNRINHQFITDFDFYLRSVRNCGNNSTVKYIKNFKKIVRIALANNWITLDPFLNYKVKLTPVEREFLTTEEIEVMLNKEMHTPRLELVRDIFIFCCFTGFAYVDVKKLTPDHVVTGIDGGKWINTNRMKTKVKTNIPLLEIPLQIIDKYKNDPVAVNGGKLLPVLSNQKSNAYLKEIADLCGITKNLTTHLARHTFATTVTLNNGVAIESVSKMLGHTSLKTTQHYAKILDKKVSNDMNALRTKLAVKTTEKNSRKIS